jgi:hypothetical protein
MLSGEARATRRTAAAGAGARVGSRSAKPAEGRGAIAPRLKHHPRLPATEETMKRIVTVLFAAALVATLAGIAAAQTYTPRIDRREARQHARIRQGVRSGELTPGETRELRQGQRHVRRMEWRAKADGRVTPRERVRVNRALDRQSRAIYRLKHNGRSM